MRNQQLSGRRTGRKEAQKRPFARCRRRRCGSDFPLRLTGKGRLSSSEGIEARYGARSRPELGPALRSGTASVPIGRQRARKGPRERRRQWPRQRVCTPKAGVDFDGGNAFLLCKRQTWIGALDRQGSGLSKRSSPLAMARLDQLQVQIAKRGQFRGAEGGPTSARTERKCAAVVCFSFIDRGQPSARSRSSSPSPSLPTQNSP